MNNEASRFHGLFAIVLPYPWNLYRLGCILIIIGVLGLLIGVLITRTMGFEGRMLIVPGESENQALITGNQLIVTSPDGQQYTFELKPGLHQLPFLEDHLRISLRVLECAVQKAVIQEGDADDPHNAAVLLALKNDRSGLEESFWLVERHPDEPQSYKKSLGPVQFFLQTADFTQEVEVPTILIQDDSGEILLDRPVEEFQSEILPLNIKGFQIKNFQYMPYATVMDNVIVNWPQGGRYNPAMALTLVNDQGQEYSMIRFAFFPEFESLHGGESESTIPLDIQLLAPLQDMAREHQKTRLTIVVQEQKPWSYRIQTPYTQPKEGTVISGSWIPLDGMGIHARVIQTLNHAVFIREVVAVPRCETGIFAVEVIVHNGDDVQSQWMTIAEKFGFRSLQGIYRFVTQAVSRELPFSIFLKDVRRTNYPGTTSLKTWESNVVLKDNIKGTQIHETVDINHSLHYQGFRIVPLPVMSQDPLLAETAVFTVTKNPGIPVLYASFFILWLGVLLQFYERGYGK
jgi:hypothetical protein